MAELDRLTEKVGRACWPAFSSRGLLLLLPPTPTGDDLSIAAAAVDVDGLPLLPTTGLLPLLVELRREPLAVELEFISSCGRNALV